MSTTEEDHQDLWSLMEVYLDEDITEKQAEDAAIALTNNEIDDDPPSPSILETVNIAEALATAAADAFGILDEAASYVEQQDRIISHCKTATFAPCNFKGCCKVYKGGAAYRNLYRHHHTAHNGDQYNCHFCTTSTNCSLSLDGHQATECLGKKRFRCNVCKSAKFSTLTDFNFHSQKHESHPCGICPMVCHTTNALQNHYKKHKTNESRTYYTCSMCNNFYVALKTLERHVLTKHPHAIKL